MFEMTTKSAIGIAKIGMTVTIFVLMSACSHESIQPVASFSQNTLSEIKLSDTEYAKPVATSQNKVGHRKAFKRQKSIASRRTLAKRARSAALAKSHNQKVEAVAQGSLSSEVALPPASFETPAVVNGPAAQDLTSPQLELSAQQSNQMSKWSFLNSLWPYGLITGLAIAWLALTSQLRRLRAKGRRLVYNS